MTTLRNKAQIELELGSAPQGAGQEVGSAPQGAGAEVVLCSCSHRGAFRALWKAERFQTQGCESHSAMSL